MSPMRKNNTEMNTPTLVQQVLESVRVPASTRSKEEAWAMLVQKIEQQKNPKIITPSYSIIWKTIAVAASLLLLISFAYFKYNTVNVTTDRGQHLTAMLPDGSEVILNACTQIQYRRYWFINTREVKLDGEAFFKVRKGRVFSVISPQNHRVEVVGTQFNVTARDATFKVICFEGQVKVISRSGKSMLLRQGNASTIVGDSIVAHKNTLQTSTSPAWTTGEFYFEAASLQTVIEELMRQYRVNILTNGFNPATRYYTGYFTNKNLQQALEWVTVPMNLQYTFLNDTTVNIYPIP